MTDEENALIDRIKTYIEKTGAVPMGYDMRIAEAKRIYSLLCIDPFRAIRLAFRYGQAKGVRSTRAHTRSTGDCAKRQAQINNLLERANASQRARIRRVVQGHGG